MARQTALLAQLRINAYGCFYWKVDSRSKLLKLGINRMEFSIVDLPPNRAEWNVLIVETGNGRLGMFSNLSHASRDTPLYYATSKNEDDSIGRNEWQMARTIPLPVHYDCCLIGASEGYIFLLGIPKVRGTPGPTCFSLDIKTLKIESVRWRSTIVMSTHILGFHHSCYQEWYEVVSLLSICRPLGYCHVRRCRTINVIYILYPKQE